MYSAYKLNKQVDNIQPWCTPFPIWNQSLVLCPVLTVASLTCIQILRMQVRWSGIPISLRIFQSLLWSTRWVSFSILNIYICSLFSYYYHNFNTFIYVVTRKNNTEFLVFIFLGACVFNFQDYRKLHVTQTCMFVFDLLIHEFQEANKKSKESLDIMRLLLWSLISGH